MQCSFQQQTRSSFINESPRRLGQNYREMPTAVQEAIVSLPTPVSITDYSSAQSSTSAVQSRSFGMLELELIHHYSTQTYITMTSRLTSHIIWRDVMFREAMRYDFLLDALMATSALHKSNLLPEGSEGRVEYSRRALAFQDSALSGYIPSLNNPTQANSVALFAISILLPVWSFGSKRLPEGFEKTAQGFSSPTLRMKEDQTSAGNLGHEGTLSFASVISLLKIIQGIDEVIMQTSPWLQKDLIELLRTPTDEDLPPNQPDVTAVFDALRDTIEDICKRDDSLSESVRERHEIYLERLQSLRQVARCRTVLEWDLYIFSWPVTVKPLFIDLLRQHDPIALVLFIYWAVCFRSLDHLWWARGWSYKLVKDVSAYLDETWSECLEWPRRSIGIEYPVSTV